MMGGGSGAKGWRSGGRVHFNLLHRLKIVLFSAVIDCRWVVISIEPCIELMVDMVEGAGEW